MLISCNTRTCSRCADVHANNSSGKDEEIQNDDNGMELLCLYLSTKLYIPPKLLHKILNISHRISYNKGKYMITIHTNSINTSNKILLQVLQTIHNNKLTNLKKQLQLNKDSFILEMENTNYTNYT